MFDDADLIFPYSNCKQTLDSLDFLSIQWCSKLPNFLAVPCKYVTKVVCRAKFAAASEGEKAKNIRAAIIPTGKNRNISGGGGSGGNNNGNTAIDAAKAVNKTTLAVLKHRTIVLEKNSLFLIFLKL
ncbi:hypothetical protein D5086_007526 [Populus alba]|uniref:Uncharacterized protein n=1 Tax=Populus alba TaxID=43335 RepID=A0ACC4CNT8_POPAL